MLTSNFIATPNTNCPIKTKKQRLVKEDQELFEPLILDQSEPETPTADLHLYAHNYHLRRSAKCTR
jgi:hypothetical protein